MKKIAAIFAVGSLLLSFSLFAKEQTKDEVIKLVTNVCGEVKAGKASSVIASINAGQHPYKNKDNPAFYAFVYDDQVTIVAHPKSTLVGKSYKGKPDIRGKMFRDKIVEGALKKGTGWVSYTYQKPGTSGEFRKKAYFNLCNDGSKNYIVVSGMYAK